MLVNVVFDSRVSMQAEIEREERQRQRGMEPPVVTRALARSRSVMSHALRSCSSSSPHNEDRLLLASTMKKRGNGVITGGGVVS